MAYAKYAVDWTGGRELFDSADEAQVGLARCRAAGNPDATAIYLGKQPELIEDAIRRGWRSYLPIRR